MILGLRNLVMFAQIAARTESRSRSRTSFDGSLGRRTADALWFADRLLPPRNSHAVAAFRNRCTASAYHEKKPDTALSQRNATKRLVQDANIRDIRDLAALMRRLWAPFNAFRPIVGPVSGFKTALNREVQGPPTRSARRNRCPCPGP